MTWRELELDDWFHTYLPGEDLQPDNLRWTTFDVDLTSECTMCEGLKKGLQDAITTVGSGDLPYSEPPSYAEIWGVSPEFRRVCYHSIEVPVQVKHETAARTTASSGTNSPPSSWTPSTSESLPPVRSTSGSESSIYTASESSEADPLQQCNDYVAELCDRQHRLFVFMLSFVNDRARLIRFDRAGASMTVEFDYALHPEIIGTFLYRLAQQDSAGRGYDPTVTPASEADAKLFRSLHTCYVPDSAVGRALADAVMESDGTADGITGWPICKLTIEGPFSQDVNRAVLPSDPVERREFLIGKPMSASRALHGRGTKVYAAYDVATGKIVVIKDSWRPSSSSEETRMRTEYDTYLLLNSAERPAGQPLLIPTLLGGGDVIWNGVVQDTPTSAGQDSDRLLTRSRTHFRLVLKEVCRPLEDFTNSLELVVAVLCAIDAHSVAWLSARILHRDVSTGNILILDEDPEGPPNPQTAKGLLADWDHARTQEELENPAFSHNIRSGTWPFISARLQHIGPEQRHELADDLESFVHVLNYCALKHLPNELSDDGDMLASFISRVYDRVRCSSSDGLDKGSIEKLQLLVHKKPFVELSPREQQPLQCLLDALSGLCYRHYHHIQFPPPQPPHIAALSQEKMSVHRGRFSHMHISDVVAAAKPEQHATETVAVATTPSLPPPDPSKSPLNSHDAIARAFLHTLEPPTSNHPAYGLGWPAADKIKRV